MFVLFMGDASQLDLLISTVCEVTAIVRVVSSFFRYHQADLVSRFITFYKERTQPQDHGAGKHAAGEMQV
jgi:hypothetical protein